MFKTYDEIKAREEARIAGIDTLKAEVAMHDADPLVPGEQYTGGDTFDGCYAGTAIAMNDAHVAILSERGDRVAILPTTRLKNQPALGERYAYASWGCHFEKLVRLGVTFKLADGSTAVYDWLDAMDDFIVLLQRQVRWDSMAMSNVFPDTFVLRARKYGPVVVSPQYRDLQEQIRRELRSAPPAPTGTPVDDLDQLVAFLWAKNPMQIMGEPARLSAIQLLGRLTNAGFATTVREVLESMRRLDAQGARSMFDPAVIQRLIPDYQGD